MKKTALIHFLPLEYYPPATNMINYLANKSHGNIQLFVFSTYNTKKRKIFENNRVKIYRTPQSEKDKNKIIRLLKYAHFQLFVLSKLILLKPEKILYYESLSSFPVYLYKKIFNKKTEVFIHYHEYTTPEQYAKQSMAIERYFHKLEQKFLYKNAVWISHTNKDRLKMFYTDNPNINENILKEMPNYPPKTWKEIVKNKSLTTTKPLKCVYVGSLSLKDTYIREFIDWVIKQSGSVSFDIFSYNLHADTLEFLEQLKSPYISFNNNGIEYNKLPITLSNYDIGVILYKGKTKNFVFNAPNKFFEYLTCGLSVWFPSAMKGIFPYIQKNGTQKVICIDFEKINRFDWENSVSDESIQNNHKEYVCDTVFETIKTELEK